ncbi:MAG: hypothetical protein R3E82_18550 [Pseudomonadales bacterium]
MTEGKPTDRQALDLFEKMLDVPANERNSYLSENCEDDVVLRKVLKMFAADDRKSGMLDDIADERFTSTISAPERIGRYRIVEMIDQGGMATVFKAERADQDSQQTVALKLILPSRRTEHWEARFLQ